VRRPATAGAVWGLVALVGRSVLMCDNGRARWPCAVAVEAARRFSSATAPPRP